MIERLEPYLDRLFDLLGGTGAAGRRILSEAQAHLEEAIQANGAAGMSQEDAEREALARFGAPEQIAQAHASYSALPVALAFGRVVAAAWLLFGIGAMALGLMGLGDAALVRLVGLNFIGEDAPGVRACQHANIDTIACRASAAAHHAREMIDGPLAAGVFGLVAVAAFLLARRVPVLRGVATLPNGAMVSTAGAVAFCGGGAVILISALLGLIAGERVEIVQHAAEGVAAIIAGLFFLPAAWRAVSRPDRIPSAAD